MKKATMFLISLGVLMAAIGCGNQASVAPRQEATATPASARTRTATLPSLRRTPTSTLPLEILECSIVSSSNLHITFNGPAKGSWKLVDPDGNEYRSSLPKDRTVEFSMATHGTPLGGRYTLVGEYLGEDVGSFCLDFQGPDVSVTDIAHAGHYAYVELENRGDLPLCVWSFDLRQSGADEWGRFHAEGPRCVGPGESKVLTGLGGGFGGSPGMRVQVKVMGQLAGEIMEALRQEAVIGERLRSDRPSEPMTAVTVQPRISAFPTPTVGSGAPPAAALTSGSPWPMFGHDPQHSNLSSHIGPARPEVKWVFTSGEISDSPVIGPDGTIYFGTVAKLYAVDPAGNLKWRFSPELENKVRAPAVGSDGTIYVVSGATFYVLSPDKSVRAELHLTAGLGPPTIASDGTVYLADAHGSLHAYDPVQGFTWSFRATYEDTPSCPAVAADGTVYFVIRQDGNTYAVNPDGTLKWRFTEDPEFNISRPWSAVGPDGTMYFGAGGTYAINPDGTLRWKSERGSDCPPAIAPDGTVCIEGFGEFYAIDPQGAIKWRFETHSTGYPTSVPAIDAQGTVYLGTNGRWLYAIDSNGRLKWNLELEDEVGSPIIGAGGTIYVPVKGGKLYAISSE